MIKQVEITKMMISNLLIVIIIQIEMIKIMIAC